MRHRPTVTCACCGRTGEHAGRGWILACHRRWRAAGRPDTGPPPPSRRYPSTTAAAIAGRIEDYRELTRDHGLTVTAAALRLGVDARTAFRYEARIRKEAP
ncbi:hypothetical protein [Spirillospora sp. NBC_01491]|uniref:hypothetical protein n=1 Tax=Spirillospora sp. NBC_01491 TaxID=2976007 RepID=UPI002E350353|nr:hypothetical protein [Spirillospora sp. NBC_01491]